MSELQQAAEQLELEWQRKREEKWRNTVRLWVWQQKKSRLEAGGKNAGR